MNQTGSSVVSNMSSLELPLRRLQSWHPDTGPQLRAIGQTRAHRSQALCPGWETGLSSWSHKCLPDTCWPLPLISKWAFSSCLLSSQVRNIKSSGRADTHQTSFVWFSTQPLCPLNMQKKRFPFSQWCLQNTKIYFKKPLSKFTCS